MMLVGYFFFTVTLAHLFLAGSELCDSRDGQLVLQLLNNFETLVVFFEQLVGTGFLQVANLFLLAATFLVLVANSEQLWFPAV